MVKQFANWLKARFSAERPVAAPNLRKTGSYVAPSPRLKKQQEPRAATDFADTVDEPAHRIESNGPGKNVLVRIRREDTGTHETLTLLDDSLVDSEEEAGLDPYNTGGFDRSKNWDRRFGK